MDFELEWTLDDARYVAGEAYEALSRNAEDKEALKRTLERGKLLTDSLEVLNLRCLPELAMYRASLVLHRPKTEQEEVLSDLYSSYKSEMSKQPFRRILTDPRGFLSALFT
jgi:hypothetical protein